MNRRLLPGSVPSAWSRCWPVAITLPPPKTALVSTGVFVDPGAAGLVDQPGTASRALSEEEIAQKKDILDGALKLIQSSATKSGGNPFQQATKNLNQYFDGTDPADFALDPATRSYLLRQMPEPVVKGLEVPTFTIRDARHLEDCMLYSSIAARVAGTGDDLTRVRRVFDWMVRQVQLVPPESLSSPDLGPVYSRPFDVLLRGMATEAEGSWAERSWLFMALCRQLGIDVGLVTYTPRGQKEPIVWACAALIDGKAYLFDARIGMAIPGPDGTGVATLDEAIRDPVVLDRLDLPGQSPYGTSRVALLNSPSKIGILIDSSTGYLSGRMRLLQQSLAGNNRTILHRDPADQAVCTTEATHHRRGHHHPRPPTADPGQLGHARTERRPARGARRPAPPADRAGRTTTDHGPFAAPRLPQRRDHPRSAHCRTRRTEAVRAFGHRARPLEPRLRDHRQPLPGNGRSADLGVGDPAWRCVHAGAADGVARLPSPRLRDHAPGGAIQDRRVRAFSNGRVCRIPKLRCEGGSLIRMTQPVAS